MRQVQHDGHGGIFRFTFSFFIIPHMNPLYMCVGLFSFDFRLAGFPKICLQRQAFAFSRVLYVGSMRIEVTEVRMGWWDG
jgi:hypothetical protein